MVTKRTTKPVSTFLAKERRFIENVVAGDKPAEAGLRARMTPEDGRSLYRNKRIRAEIDRQLAAVSEARIELVAKSRAIQQSDIDAELVKAYRADVLKVGMVKVKAAELAYRRIGLLIDDNFIPDAPTGSTTPGVDVTPRIYRALDTQIISHTIETRQEVRQHQTEIVPAPNPSTEVEGGECHFKY